MKNFLSFIIVIIFFASCSEYQKVLKSEDSAVKYAMAKKLYEKKKYDKAIRIFEQISSEFRGKPESENMYFMFSQSYFKTEQYYLAGYQFENFVSSFPDSERVQEASFLGAKSYSMLSPVYSLDQTDTTKGIEKLQAFIDTYPNSEYLAEANIIFKKLNDKLERKSFENAKGYNTVSDYKAALVALDNFIADFPGTPYKEDALFYKYDSAYQLGINSVPSKMEERLNVAKVAYANLIKYKADTKYKKQADEMFVRIEKDLEKFIK